MAADAGEKMNAAGQKTEEKAREVQGMMHQLKQKAPTSRQLLGVLVLLTMAAILFAVGGLLLTGTVITLLLATPLFLLFSPVLVPLGLLAFFVTAAFVVTAVSVVGSIAGATWLYKYIKGRHPVGSDQLEAARHRLADTASHFKERALEYGSNVSGFLQNKSRDVAPGA